MNGTELAVLIGGAGVIGLLRWFFFGPKRAVPAAPAPQEGGARADLILGGMTCAACVARVEKAARRVPGVAEVAVNLLASRGAFRYDPALTSPPVIAAAIEKIGFEAAPRTPETPLTDHAAEGRRLARRFWGAAGLTLPVVVGAMGGEMGWPMPAWLTAPWTQLLFTTPVLFWTGGPFFRGAWLSLKQRGSDMNTLIALGTGTAYGYSLAATALPGLFGPQSHVYPACSAPKATSTTRRPTSSSPCCCWAGCWKRGRRAERARPSRRCSACSPRPHG